MNSALSDNDFHLIIKLKVLYQFVYDIFSWRITDCAGVTEYEIFPCHQAIERVLSPNPDDVGHTSQQVPALKRSHKHFQQIRFDEGNDQGKISSFLYR